MSSFKILTKFNLILGSAGIITLLLGIFIFIFGEASSIGLWISLVTGVVLSGILLVVSISDIAKRINVRINLVGVRGSIYFVNKSSWQKQDAKDFIEPLVSYFDKKMSQTVQEALDSPLGTNFILTLPDKESSLFRAVSHTDFEPETFVYLMDEGTVFMKKGGVRKKVAGYQQGNSIYMEYVPYMNGVSYSLLKHELGHLLLSSACPHTSTNWQHCIMSIKNF